MSIGKGIAIGCMWLATGASLSKSPDSESWSLRFPRFLRFRDDK